LLAHFALGQSAGRFKQAVCKRAFAMIYVSDNRKISYL